MFVRPGVVDSIKQRNHIETWMSSWSNIALLGLRAESPATTIDMSIGAQQVSLRLDADGAFENANELLSLCGDIFTKWEETPWRAKRCTSFDLPPIEHARMFHWCCFFYMWCCEDFGFLTEATHMCWQCDFLRALSRLVAYGVELWFASVYCPTMNWRMAAVRPLAAQKRRRRLDPATVERWMLKSSGVGGSLSASMSALSDRKGLDSEANHKLVLLYCDRRRDIFRDSTHLALSWDPGTYSGRSWNIGVAYAPDLDVACNLTPKGS